MNQFRLLFTLLLAGTFHIGLAQEFNKEGMVKKIFNVFREKNEMEYIRLFPDAALTRDFIRDIMKQEAGGDSANHMIDEFVKTISDSSLRLEYMEDFHRYLVKGEKSGVDWSKAELLSFTADSAVAEQEDGNYPQLTGKIYFKVGAVEYFMSYSEVIWFTGKGWYGVHIKRVDKKENEAKEPEEEDQIEDNN